MDFQTISAIIFVLLLSLFIFVKRKNIITHKILFPLLYFSMYRTKIGLKFMDRVAKRFSKPLKYIAYFGVVIGFIGMVLIGVLLFVNSYKLFVQPEAQPGVGVVQPFKEGIPGTVFVPFFYFIISIFILAVVHEFSHGIIAKRYGLKIKSSGFAVLGILIPVLPAAFVEPDEKELRKRPAKEQLSIFAAGPFANILLAFIVLLITGFIVAPAVDSMIEFDGVLINDFIRVDDEIYPAEKAGMHKGEIIKEIDNIKADYLFNFSSILEGKSAGDAVNIKTNRGSYDISLAENPEDKSKGYLGVYVKQSKKIKESTTARFGNFLPMLLLWFVGLFYWLYILNLGIGLFNLVPIGPIDGGRMLRLSLLKFFKKEKAEKLWKFTGIFFLFLILINILFAFF